MNTRLALLRLHVPGARKRLGKNASDDREADNHSGRIAACTPHDVRIRLATQRLQLRFCLVCREAITQPRDDQE